MNHWATATMKFYDLKRRKSKSEGKENISSDLEDHSSPQLQSFTSSSSPKLKRAEGKLGVGSDSGEGEKTKNAW